MLINLVSIHPGESPQAIPLANAFLKSFVRESSIEISLTDFFVGQSPAIMAAELCSSNPIAVGFSMYIWNRSDCHDVASEIRRTRPEILIFAGGPEATADPEGVLESALFNFAIAGEGELPFSSLCERLTCGEELYGIRGIVFPGDKNGTHSLSVPDLDTIPSPFLNGILDTGSYSGILWQLARGCSFACDFCFDARRSNSVRRFSMERVEAELRHFAAKGVSQVFVLDSTFNQNAKRAKNILRLIKKIAPQIHFHFEVRSEFIDQEMAQLFARITCSLQIGLQSSDPDVLRHVGRSFNNKDFSKKIAYLNESGAVFGFDLIYGLPADTLEGFCNSLDFALSLYPNHLDIFPLAVLPGTKLSDTGKDYGLAWLGAPPYTLLSTPTFSVDDLAAADKIAKACDIFFTRGRAVAWFNSVIEILCYRPSFFLICFAEWLASNSDPDAPESSYGDNKILTLQKDFIDHIFHQKKLDRLLPIVLDLINYHHLYAKALLAPQPPKFKVVKSVKNLSTSHFKLAQSANLFQFNYDIHEVLDCGAPDLQWMMRHLNPVGSHAVIYPNQGCVCTESLDGVFFAILKQMDGTMATGKIMEKLSLSLESSLEFLFFCQQEGIILPA